MAEDEARGVTGGWRWPLGPIRILIIATALLSVVFLLIPNLDIWFSRQFYDPEIGFPALRIPALQWLRDLSGLLLWAAGAVVVVSLLGKLFVFPRRPSIVPGRAMLFLSSTLALGSGLLVNGILKSLWGRPRPTQVLEFGGDSPFVTAWHISDYCARNCSFVSGEASAAIWLVAIALVVPARFRRAALAVAITLAVAFSLNRIAFGGHFLSDVLLAWTLTLLVMAVAWHFLYVRPPRFLEETAIDGALTRAGLWIRGVVSRRKTTHVAPLHPEAAAVLAADAEAHPPQPQARPKGLRAAGHGFAETVGPDDEIGARVEPRLTDNPPWAEDVHRDTDPPGDDAPHVERDVPESPHEAPYGGSPLNEGHALAAEAAVRDAVEHGFDLTDEDVRAALLDEPVGRDVPAVIPPAASDESIESIDPEPEETAPPRADPVEVIAALETLSVPDASGRDVEAEVAVAALAEPKAGAASAEAAAAGPAEAWPTALPPEPPPAVAVFPSSSAEPPPATPPDAGEVTDDEPSRPPLELPPPDRT